MDSLSATGLRVYFLVLGTLTAKLLLPTLLSLSLSLPSRPEDKPLLTHAEFFSHRTASLKWRAVHPGIVVADNTHINDNKGQFPEQIEMSHALSYAGQ